MADQSDAGNAGGGTQLGQRLTTGDDVPGAAPPLQAAAQEESHRRFPPGGPERGPGGVHIEVGAEREGVAAGRRGGLEATPLGNDLVHIVAHA
eukprot:807296-Prorocentrum_minimum.AAC.1